MQPRTREQRAFRDPTKQEAEEGEVGTLERVNILIVEDEYLIAAQLTRSLTGAGANVVGPAPNVDSALERIEAGEQIDGAILDVRLQGEYVFPVAEALSQRGTPFVFATGYDMAVIPSSFADVPRYAKPVDPRAIAVDLLS